MTDSTPLVEKVARAICASANRHGYPDPDRPSDFGWEEWQEEARAALDASGNDELLKALKAIQTACNFGVNAPVQALAYVEQLASDAIAPTQEPESKASAVWQHVLEDGSLDHEWVTEAGVTFCTHCEAAREDYE